MDSNDDNITEKTMSVSGVLQNGLVAKLTAETKPGNTNVLTAKSSKEMPGHTGYLTFATFYPQHRYCSID